MKTVNGITVPEGSDLASASALRQFAEDVDAKLQQAWSLHHAARHPDCAIIAMSSGLTASAGAWNKIGAWGTAVRSTGGPATAAYGISMNQYTRGIYLVGGTLRCYTYGSPSGMDVRLTIFDETGTKFSVPVTTESYSTRWPDGIRGEEFVAFIVPTELHMNLYGYTELEVYVHGGTSAVGVPSGSKMWFWRVRDLENA